MAQINQEIGPQAFEIVLIRIGEILANELANQFQLFETPELENLEVWVNRYVPFDKSEMPAVNISVDNGQYSGQTAKGTDDGLYTYNIDVFTNAKGRADDYQGDEGGDQLAIAKRNKIMGIIRAILRNPAFNTLGYDAPPGFVMGIPHVNSILFAEPNTEDTARNVMGRVVFEVKLPETTSLLEPDLLYGYETVVKLEFTEKGYKWKN